MNQSMWLLLLFVSLWIVTFYPCWLLLLKLLAISASAKKITWRFWAWLLLYRVLLALPYIALLIAGSDVLPTVFEVIIVGFLVFGMLFSILRFAFRAYLISSLWWLYGFVYDGLRHFAPYRRLTAMVVARSYAASPDAEHILELGCGSGNVLAELAERYPHSRLTGVDSSRSMLASAQKKVPSATIVAQEMVTFLKAAHAGTYDLIVMQNSLYAVEERDELWKHLCRVLKPGGAVVITNSDREGSGTITREHLRYGHWYELLHPKLILVGVIDAYISQLSKAGSFHFLGEEQIAREVSGYFQMSETERCYGGVNILFTLKKDIRE